MAQPMAWLAGAGVGAGLMYVLDPRAGRRRRARVRDKLVSVGSRSDDAIAATARDLANRARGVVAEARALFSREEVSDEVLAERVRTELGHWVSRPSAITVTASQGRVTLGGLVLASEVDDLVRAVRRVRGVEAVDDRVEVHREPGDVPRLQGGVGRRGRRFELMQSSWSPAARVLTGGAGIALVAAAARRQTALSGLIGVAGLGLLARARGHRPLPAAR